MAKGYGPLSGLVVIDLTQFLSGPLATMILADLGADVIKIERPDRPKASGPFLNGERIYDLSVQRSKRSVTLNLKMEADKKILLELVKKADVLVENFKPGTMERMGLGYPWRGRPSRCCRQPRSWRCRHKRPEHSPCCSSCRRP